MPVKINSSGNAEPHDQRAQQNKNHFDEHAKQALGCKHCRSPQPSESTHRWLRWSAKCRVQVKIRRRILATVSRVGRSLQPEKIDDRAKSVKKRARCEPYSTSPGCVVYRWNHAVDR